MKVDQIVKDEQGDLLRVELTGSDGYRYAVHHVYEPSTVTDEWKGIWDVLENVYNAREDTQHSSYIDWLYRLNSVVERGNCVLVYKYRGSTLVGIALLHEAIALHYGDVLSVYGIYNHEGNAKGFYKVFKMLCKESGVSVLSRVKYLSPYRYLQIYTRI